MTTQAPFSLHGRNPDILSCIASLSNDEVFTPPEFANRMLDTVAEAWAADNDGANIWANSSVTFLDPCTKSGVFLREITSRLTEGLATEMPDLQTRVNHILTKQVFGIGITRLTSLMARRSVYCSKHAQGSHSIANEFATDDGNIWYERMEHTWINGRCTYCGASEMTLDRGDDRENYAYAFIHTDNIKSRIAEMFGANMQFDVIIGNPPYQLATGGGSATQQAMPIYHEFVKQAKAMEPKIVIMVIPSRWFSGGMSVLDSFRSSMLNDERVQVIVDFPDSREAFSGVDIAGGVSYFLWNSAHQGACRVSTVLGGCTETIVRRLNEYSVFVRDNKSIQTIDKVTKHHEFQPLSKLVSAVSPFGLPTSFRGAESSEGISNPVVVRSTAGVSFIDVADVTKNRDWINVWKVLLSATTSEHAGQADRQGRKRLFSRIEVLEPGSVVTHSYLIVGPTSTQIEAENLAGYIRTKFVRFLVSNLLATQHVSKSNFAFVPIQDFTKAWTDSELYERYALSASEIQYIESMMRTLDDQASSSK